MTTPNLGALRRWLYRRADRIEGHVGMRHVDDWARLLEQNGLRVRDSWTYLHGFLPGRYHRRLAAGMRPGGREGLSPPWAAERSPSARG